MVIHRAEGEIGRETSKKVLSEKEYRKRILNVAYSIGAQKEVLMWFAKADKAMRNAKSAEIWADQRRLLILELFDILGKGGELTIDGELVYRQG